MYFFSENWICLRLNISVMARGVLAEKRTFSGDRWQGEEGENALMQIFPIVVSSRGLLLFAFLKFEISSQFSNNQTDVSSTFMTEM